MVWTATTIESAKTKIDESTGIVAVGHVTVGTGTTNPLSQISAIAHNSGAALITDASRSIGFQNISISDLHADIVVFSGNLGLMGPPGLSLQWINPTIGENYNPGILGGSAVANVENKSFELAFQPDKFESGIINVPAIAGLRAALDYLAELKQNYAKKIENLMGNAGYKLL